VFHSSLPLTRLIAISAVYHTVIAICIYVNSKARRIDENGEKNAGGGEDYNFREM
jgi:hypothetical protein